jgi:hypothetical protein
VAEAARHCARSRRRVPEGDARPGSICGLCSVKG